MLYYILYHTFYTSNIEKVSPIIKTSDCTEKWALAFAAIGTLSGICVILSLIVLALVCIIRNRNSLKGNLCDNFKILSHNKHRYNNYESFILMIPSSLHLVEICTLHAGVDHDASNNSSPYRRIDGSLSEYLMPVESSANDKLCLGETYITRNTMMKDSPPSYREATTRPN